MLHILTVHWNDDRWVDIQLRYLYANIKTPFKAYAFLNGLQEDHRSKFFYSSSELIKSHPIKLNLLADMATLHSNDPDDLLMFIDGDAFPIGDILSFGVEKLADYPLIAIQRREHLGDIQPHPCFCLTTIGFWNDIDGDWKEGYTWVNETGAPVTDVGGNLLKILLENDIEWHPMLRSNRRNLHPIWFGLYEDLIYHHGAGFRTPFSRHDESQLGGFRSVYYKLFNNTPRLIRKLIPEKHRPLAKVANENRMLIDQVYESIQEDPSFYLYFQQSEESRVPNDSDFES